MGSSVLWKILSLLRYLVFGVGMVVVLAVVLGVASMALAANGKPFLLGRNNSATAITALIRQGAGAALSLKVQSGQPPLVVNSATKVGKLNADSVDGFSANGMARVSRGGTTTLFSGLDFVDLTSTTIEAPAKGYVLVNATVLVNTDTVAACSPACAGHAYVLNQTSGQKSPDSVTQLPIDSTAPVPVTWVFPVEAGNNVFRLRAGKFPFGSSVEFYNPTLTALYVPFDGSGNTPTAIATSSAEASAAGVSGEQTSGVILAR